MPLNLRRAQQMRTSPTVKTLLSKPTLAPSHHQLLHLGASTPVDPAKQAEASELLATVRKGGAYVQERVERELEAEVGMRSPEYMRLLDTAAALRQAILRAEQVGAVEAYDALVAVRDQHLVGPTSVYAVEDEEKRRKKAQREKERRKRKLVRDREAAAAAKAAAVDAPVVVGGADEDGAADGDEDETRSTPVAAVDSLAASTMSLDVLGSGQSTASVLSDKEGDDDEALSSSTPASSSHGDTPTAVGHARTPSHDPTTPVKPSEPLPEVEPEQPIASTSRAPSPEPVPVPVATLNWADDVAAELDGIDAPTAAAIAAARAESPIPRSAPLPPADDEWQEVVKAPRAKRGERHDGGMSSANAPPPHAYESQAFVLRGRGVAGSTPAPHPGQSSSALSLPFRPTTLGDAPAAKSSWGRGNYVSGIKSAGYEDHDSHRGREIGPDRPPEPPWTARSPVPYLFNEPGSRGYVDDTSGERHLTARVSLRPVPGLAESFESNVKRIARNRAGVREFTVHVRAKTARDPAAVAPSWLNDEPVNVKLSGPTSVRVPVAHPRFEKYEQAAALQRDEERRIREAAEAADRERQRVEREVAQIAAESKAIQAAQQLALRRPASQSPMTIPVSTFEAPVAIMPNGAIEQLPAASVAPPPAVPHHIDTTAPSSSRASPAPSMSSSQQQQPPPPHYAPPPPPSHFDGPPMPQQMPPIGMPFQGPDGMMYVIDPSTGSYIPLTLDAMANLFAAHGLPLPPGMAPPPPLGPPPSAPTPSSASPAVGLDFFHAQNGAVPPTRDSSSSPPIASTSSAPVMMPPPMPPMQPPVGPAFFVPAARSAKIQIRAPVPGQIPPPRPRVSKSPVQTLRGSVMASSASASSSPVAPTESDYGPGVPHNGVVYYGAPAPIMYGGGPRGPPPGPMMMGGPPPPPPSSLQLADPAILATGGSSKGTGGGGGSDAYAPDRPVYAGTPPV